jgi:hypothetical protein
MVIELQAILNGARVDKEGAWKVTLEVSPQDGPRIAELAMLTETVFKVIFEAQDEQVFGRKAKKRVAEAA